MNTIFTSQEQTGGEPATSHFHRSVQSQLGYLTQLITAIVTSLRDWKTISMITRTNKISNCYHPSHLPPVISARACACVCGGVGGGVTVVSLRVSKAQSAGRWWEINGRQPNKQRRLGEGINAQHPWREQLCETLALSQPHPVNI